MRWSGAAEVLASPLAGEAAERSEAGGGYSPGDWQIPRALFTPLPNPPPQGGREHSAPALGAENSRGEMRTR